jgi:hypothetical protein
MVSVAPRGRMARRTQLHRALTACLRPLHCACLGRVFFFLLSPLALSLLLLRPSTPPPPAAAPAGAAAAAARALALALVSPPAVNPWRASLLRGRLDWHDLVPQTFLVGARGEAAAEALNRHLREDAKVALLGVLQGRVGSALGSAGLGSGGAAPRLRPAFGEDAAAAALAEHWVAAGQGQAAEGGALGALEGCPLVRDGCLLHGSLLACLGNSLCGWCAASSTCLTRGGSSGVPCAPTPGTPRGEPAGALEVAGRRLEDSAGVLLVSAAAVPSAANASASASASASSRASNATACSILLREARLTVEIAGNSKMAYHWAGETLPSWVQAAAGAPGGLGGVDTLVLYRGAWHDLLALAYVFSRNCPRSDSEAVLARVCSGGRQPAGLPEQLAAVGAGDDAVLAVLPSAASAAAAQGGLGAEAALAAAVQRGGHRLSLRQAREVLQGLGRGEARYDAWLAAAAPALGSSGSGSGSSGSGVALSLLRREAAWLAGKGLALSKDAGYAELAGAVCLGEGSAGSSSSSSSSAPEPPLVVIVSRRDKRLLLNEGELVALVHSLGAEAAVVALEGLPLCAQVRLFRRARVLLGMHGSGLINSMYMRPGSALVQVVPHALSGAEGFFRGPAEARGVRYYEIATPERAAAIAHGHFLKEPARAEEHLAQGSGCCGSATYFSFFINQDVVVDVDLARAVLLKALGSGK